MTFTKKLTAILLAMLMTFSVCVVMASAEEAQKPYDYMSSDWYKDTQDPEKQNPDKGIFAKYGEAYAIYNIVGGKMKTVADATENGWSTSISADYDKESVRVDALYGFECPTCHKLITGLSLADIYAGKFYCFTLDDEEMIPYANDENAKLYPGVCPHCAIANAKALAENPEAVVTDTILPAPEELHIYRFLVAHIDAKDIHAAVYRKFNFTKSGKDVFGSTAGLYEGGKDLSEYCIKYEEGLVPMESGSIVANYSVGVDTGAKSKICWGAFLWKLVLKLEKVLKWITDSSTMNSVIKTKIFLTKYTLPMKFLMYPLTLFTVLINNVLNSGIISF